MGAAKAEEERLLQLGLQQQEAAHAREKELHASYGAQLRDLEEQAAADQAAAQQANDEAEHLRNTVADLKAALTKANHQIDSERAKAQALQDEIDGIQKTIWLRKYDAAS